MSQCTPCQPCGDIPNSVVLLKKLDYMISDNYTLLFILVIIIVVLGLALTYFLRNLISTLQVYFKGKKEKEPPIGDNPRLGKDDSYTYYPSSKEDPDRKDDLKIPENKGKFVDELETRYKEVTSEQSTYIKAHYNGRENDDPITSVTLFQGHDKYRYDKDDSA